MQITTTTKNIRISPEKVRLVAGKIKKLGPKQALDLLGFINKSSSPVLKKVIQSALANAKNNFNLNEESLTFKEIQVTKGAVFKRYRPQARGRVHQILKRTSHIKVILEGEKQGQSKDSKETKLIENTKNIKTEEKK